MHALLAIVSLVSVICEPHDWTRWGHHSGGFYGTNLVDGARTIVGPLIPLCVVSEQKFSGPLVGHLVVLLVVRQFYIKLHTLNDVCFGVANSHVCMIQHPICTSYKLQHMQELHQPIHIPTDS